MQRATGLLTLGVLCTLCVMSGGVAGAAAPAMAPAVMVAAAGSGAPMAAAGPAASLTPGVRKYDLNVSLVRAAPDCFQKTLILANGEWGYPIEVTQGEILEVTVRNNIPKDWPTVSEGISIHWHGFSMRGDDSGMWYDGVAYLTMCPILSGQTFVYRFTVEETPGTYWWHGHSGVDRVDGLFGPLIVRPRGREPLQYDDEIVLMVGDWWHGQADTMAMKLNRPFDAAKQTNDSGGWVWVDLPQAVLLNGHGFYQDCELLGAGNSATPISCDVTTQWLPPGRSKMLPFNDPSNPGCARYNATVEAGKTYRIRIINVGALVYLTLVFEGHPVTIVAADAFPVQPLEVDQVDINLGQRYDVLLKADQPAGSYWITAQPQFRTGSPSGYGVLRYATPNTSLPETQSPLPDTFPPWTLDEMEQIRALDTSGDEASAPGQVRTASIASDYGIVYPNGHSSRTPPPANRTLLFNNTQPLLNTGQLRWALNNVASILTPACTSMLHEVYSTHVTDYILLNTQATLRDPQALEDEVVSNERGSATQVPMFVEGITPLQMRPVPGVHVVDLARGDVIDLIIFNLPANANNGDYRAGVGATRNATEQHPFHMHGHHFWVLGHGVGDFNQAFNQSNLNLEDPPLRDTYTVYKGGWTVIRFVADNPGLWNFHCHTNWHNVMGQRLVFSEDLDNISDAPPNFPTCPTTCLYSFAPFTKPFVEEVWGKTGY